MLSAAIIIVLTYYETDPKVNESFSLYNRTNNDLPGVGEWSFSIGRSYDMKNIIICP